MKRASGSMLGMAILLAACAGLPSPAPVAGALWQDQAFAHDPALVSVDARSLFALDADMLRALRAGDGDGTQPARRRERLLDLVFGPDAKAFAYAGGHSTVATDTWHNQRGDCLSLSIMSLALARALDLQVQVQEVRVPVSFDRRGGVDFLNAHVNILMPNDRPLQALKRWLPAGDIVIDFEPQIGSRQRGTALSDRALLARFLNNLAAEHMAQGRDRLAYAHFKAAIQADPAYAAAHNNLAQLYLRAGLPQGAEALLRHTLALNPDSDLALGSLHRLLLAQGRSVEAAQYEQRLLARRERDPYYWLGLGIVQLRQGQPAQAVESLEQAQSLSNGFEEVHHHLAIAYGRTGQLHKARDQMAVLGGLGRGPSGLAQLGKKFQQAPDTPPRQ